jgi:hypothetical protein
MMVRIEPSEMPAKRASRNAEAKEFFGQTCRPAKNVPRRQQERSCTSDWIIGQTSMRRILKANA